MTFTRFAVQMPPMAERGSDVVVVNALNIDVDDHAQTHDLMGPVSPALSQEHVARHASHTRHVARETSTNF